MVIPTINPVSMTAHRVFFTPKISIIRVVICCAAPLSATCFPNIAPKPRIITKKPSVFPIPFSIELTTAFSSMPCAIPTERETMIKAIKAFNRKTMIKKKRSKIPRVIITKGIKKF